MIVIGPSTNVTIDFTLSLESGATDNKDSFQFTYGSGEMFPRFEEELSGLSVGEEKDITLSPAEAFGEKDPHLIREVPLEELSKDTEVKPGESYEYVDKKGNQKFYRVMKVEKDYATVDFNHPLAGDTLYFHVVVRDIKSSGV